MEFAAESRGDIPGYLFNIQSEGGWVPPDLAIVPSEVRPPQRDDSEEPTPLIVSSDARKPLAVEGSGEAEDAPILVDVAPRTAVLRGTAAVIDRLPPPNEGVEAKLRQTIDEKGGKITFAEFMNISLYSEDGYYTSERVGIGEGRDFTTAPELHPAFGATMANAAEKLWTGMGRPSDFNVVELGAGNGVLARDFLAKLKESPNFERSVNYIIGERSPTLIERQQETLQGYPVSWVQASADALPLRSVQGVFLSNELPDAFPVHRLIRRDGQVMERYVTYDENGNFKDIEDVISPEVNDPFYTDRVLEGVETSACPQMLRWQESVAAALDRGYLVTADYATDNPQIRPDTFVPRAYGRTLAVPGDLRSQGRGDIAYAYMRPGTLDMTASVDYGHLQQMGQRVGLQVVQNTLQKAYLQAHGFDKEARAVYQREITNKGISHRDRAALLLRHGQLQLSGDTNTFRSFRVLTQAKGV